jgi:hypothetical protein
MTCLAGSNIGSHKDAEHTFNDPTEALDDLDLILAFMGQACLTNEAIPNTGRWTFLAHVRPRARETHKWTVEFVLTAKSARHQVALAINLDQLEHAAFRGHGAAGNFLATGFGNRAFIGQFTQDRFQSPALITLDSEGDGDLTRTNRGFGFVQKGQQGSFVWYTQRRTRHRLFRWLAFLAVATTLRLHSPVAFLATGFLAAGFLATGFLAEAFFAAGFLAVAAFFAAGLVADFAGLVFLAGFFLPTPTKATRASIKARAASRVTAAGSWPLGKVALVVPSVT